jgi:hypothetical protein
MMQAGTEASRYSGGSRQKDTSFGRMMLVCLVSGRDDTSSRRMEQWTDERPDRVAQLSRWLTGNLISSIFFAVQNLLKML